jgi:DNA invertase Pin-like site-specific DNA recombinase
MKIAIYCRVSTDEQATYGVSMLDQKERGISFSTEKGYTYEVFEDAGYSGTLPISERPSLNRLFQQVFLDEIQGVFVVDFDRLSREIKEAFTIREQFKKHGVKLFDCNGEISLYDETHSLLLSVNILLGDFEIQRTRARIKRNLERNALEGKVGGGNLLNYGYKKGGDKKFEIDNTEAEIVKLIYNLCIQGMGTKVIANYLNEKSIPTKRNLIENGALKVRGKLKSEFLWRDATLYRILKNPIYKGKRLFKEKEIDCPSIISEETWQLAQKSLSTRNQFKNTTNKNFYLLKGLITCGVCFTNYYGKRRETLRDNHYSCNSNRYKGESCVNRGINIDKLDNFIWDLVLSLPDKIQSQVVEGKDEYQKKIQAEILSKSEIQKKIQNKIVNLINNFGDNDKASIVKKEILKLENRNTQLSIEIDDLERNLSMSNSHKGLISSMRKQLKAITKETLTFDTKQRIIRAFVNRIIIKWVEPINEHLIFIDFNVNKLSDLELQGIVNFPYSQVNWKHKGKSINYQFRFINHRVTMEKSEDGETKKITLHQNSRKEDFSVVDEIVERYNQDRETINKFRRTSDNSK